MWLFGSKADYLPPVHPTLVPTTPLKIESESLKETGSLCLPSEQQSQPSSSGVLCRARETQEVGTQVSSAELQPSGPGR